MACILFITALYPQSDNQSRMEKTFALHNFVKYWVDDNIIVIKPIKIKKKEFHRFFQIEKRNVGNVLVYLIPYFRQEYLSFFFRFHLYHLLKKLNIHPDIIVSHYKTSHIFGRQIALKFGIPLICGIHVTDINCIKANNSSGKKISTAIVSANVVACRSFQIKRKLLELLPPHSVDKKLFVVNSGIAEKHIRSKDFFLEKTNKEEFPALITVSTLKARKHIDNAIKAFGHLSPMFSSYTIVGGGPVFNSLVTLSKKIDTEDKIQFVGHVDSSQVFPMLINPQIFLLVSSNETFGLVYLEAMAYGCIVIGLKNEGIDGIIVDGENGFLCPDPSVASIEHILRKVLSLTQQEKKKILMNARNTILMHTEQSAGLRYRKLIQQAMDAHFYENKA
ncbi:glycosyltransferase family 4 protein [Sediminispirochaeta bajacaliforniensis]|uniref:glycosyltransferase family 4 protein n=1 Tax=Sediminispirochaeta bajacaliforniensis TaxID=148 RepID=UPI00036EF04F|nr:glycosyltransferase family 4 protein [Sediminispirochaeta bajacaliforniensis]